MNDIHDGAVVSEPSLRSLITAGVVGLAARRLGRPYRLDGIVVHGDHRGRELGFPTANLSFDALAAVPADGVYAGRVVLLDAGALVGAALDRSWPAGAISGPAHLGIAAISVGTNPTFDGRERRIEAHILDFDGDLYGRRVGVEFTRRLRGMLRFDGIPALIAQMRHDCEQARQHGLSS